MATISQVFCVHTASSMPNAPPATEMMVLSESSSRASWPRLAPNATRMAVSWKRAEARPSRNKPTLTHAIRNSAPAAKSSSVPMRERRAALSGVKPV